MKQKKTIVQEDLILEFFKNNPTRSVRHPEVVDWATSIYHQKTGKIFRDPDRAIRKLYEKGVLVKEAKGIYKYDPKNQLAKDKHLEDFTLTQKEEILKRDGYKCVICGGGKKEGLELHVDHIKAKELGGKAVIDNGQVLCSQHNFLKKTLKQTETGKKMFIRLYTLAKKENNQALINFCVEILEKYEQHNINGHIVWKK